ncbi:MAG: XRE family transcriptional regulator [Actinobacteria bacterium]|nr:XRE family transcriptional regulator [Actinomycetota bacterium]
MGVSLSLAGAEIRRRRIALGMSQKDLAAGVVTAAYLSLIESGKRTASPTVATALAEKLGIDLVRDSALEAALRRMFAALLAGERESAGEDLALAVRLDGSSPLTRLMQARWDEYHEFYAVAQSEYLDLSAQFSPESEMHVLAVLGSCRCARSTGHSDSSISLGLALLRSDPPVDVHSDVLIELRGVVAGLLTARGEFDTALLVARLEIPGTSASPWATATSKWVQSSTYQETGQFELALMTAREALSAASEVNRPQSIARLQIVNAFLELRQPNFDPAVVTALVEAAEPVFQRFQHATDLALCAAVRARLDGLMHGVPSCLPAFKQAIDRLREHDVVQALQMCTHLGEMCLASGLLNDARDALAQAQELLSSCEHKADAARTWTALGHLHEQLGDTVAAVSCLKKAAECAGLTAFLGKQPTSAAHTTTVH